MTTETETTLVATQPETEAAIEIEIETVMLRNVPAIALALHIDHLEVVGIEPTSYDMTKAVTTILQIRTV